jgi:hypothetical protein
VEYSYQNSASDKLQTAFLSEQSLIIRSADEIAIPYSMIIEVKLVKESDKHFKIQLKTDSGNTFTISNRYYAPNKTAEDQSRVYATFVRVLHFHLKDKSKAIFTSDNNTGKTWVHVVAAVVLSFLISFTAEFLGFRLVNPLVQGVVLAAMLGIVILAMNLTRLPRHYAPADIPLEFLP